MSSKLTKIEIESFLRMKLSIDERWAVRALMLLYTKNTLKREKRAHFPRTENKKGFSKSDGPFLISLAARLIKYKPSNRVKQLTTGEKKKLLDLIPKYRKQILELSDKERIVRMALSYYRK